MVRRDCRQRTVYPNQRTIVRDRESTLVEGRVVIRAKAQDVPDYIGSIVWPTKRANVGCLRVQASSCLDRHAADLASVAVQRLHVNADLGVTNDARHIATLTWGGHRALGGTRHLTLVNATWPRRRGQLPGGALSQAAARPALWPHTAATGPDRARESTGKGTPPPGSGGRRPRLGHHSP